MTKLLTVLLLLVSFSALAKSRGGSHHHHSTHRHHSAKTHASRTRTVHTTTTHRHRTRSTTARARFQRENPCPATGKPTGPCPGYVIDHRVPLKRGGPDSPDNMQWQTREAAKAKDRIE